MFILEPCLIGILVLWACSSLLFCFRVPKLHFRLVRINRSKLFVHWSLFSPSTPALRPGTFELLYRDRDGSGGVSEWRTGASGYGWAWHACVWLPRRYIASAVQNLGREIRSHAFQEPPQSALAMRYAVVLRDYVDRTHPQPTNCIREMRIVRRFASDDSVEELIWDFPSDVVGR